MEKPDEVRKGEENEKRGVDLKVENIKFSIRKKHRADTTRLLILYGIVLVIFLWYFINYNLLP